MITSTVPVLASFSNNGRTITLDPPPAAAGADDDIAASPAGPTAGPQLRLHLRPPRVLPTRRALPTHRLAGAAALLRGGRCQPRRRRARRCADRPNGGKRCHAGLCAASPPGTRQPWTAHASGPRCRYHSDPGPAGQRANAAAPAIYVCVHAASQGTGVRLYTALTARAERMPVRFLIGIPRRLRLRR